MRHPIAARSRLRAAAIEALLALLGSTVFVAVLLWPLVSRLGSAVLGGEGSDAAATIGWLWRIKDDGFHVFGSTVHSLPGVPISWEKANGSNLQVLLVYFPAQVAAKVVGETIAHNLVVLSGFVLSGAAMYLLTRYLGCARLVSAWAGIVYVIFPWHLERAVHASLVHIEILALVVLALVAAVEHTSVARLAVLGTLVFASWLTTGYFGPMAAIGAVSFALASGLVVRDHRHLRARFVAGTTVAALSATALVAVLALASGFGRGEGLGRSAGSLSLFGLRPAELVIPSPDNLLVGNRLRAFHERGMRNPFPEETSNYLGLLTIALACSWLVVAWRRRAELTVRVRAATTGLATMVIVALAFALPSPIAILGHEWAWTPSRLLWEVLPAFRVPTRWIALVITALVPLAALALQAAAFDVRQWARGTWLGPIAPAALVLGATVVSALELGVDPTGDLFRVERVPPRYEALDRTPLGTLAEYPLLLPADVQFWQRAHGRRMLNEIPAGSPAWSMRNVVVDPGGPGTAPTLAALGVAAIITHVNALDFTAEAFVFNANVPHFPDASWGSGYRLVERLPDGASVWEVTARPAPALVTLPGGFGEPVPPIATLAGEAGRAAAPPAEQRVGFPLVQQAGVGYFEFRAKRATTVRLTFQAKPPHGRQQDIRLANARSEHRFALQGWTRVTLRVGLPGGVSRLLVKTDPAPTSEDDAVVVSTPWIERAEGPPVLHAEPADSET